MNIKDEYAHIAGRIRLCDIDMNGAGSALAEGSNVITYSAAGLLARMLAADPGAFPRHIGFIYGTEPNPSDLADPAVSRNHSWVNITDDVANMGANMLICPLVLPPAVSRDPSSDADLYSVNMTTFTSHTGAFTEYAFPTTGGPYAAVIDNTVPIYFYHAVLLNRRQSGAAITYTPFARVKLGSAPFVAKVANRELAIYWDVVFK